MYDFLDWVIYYIYECLVSDLTFRMWGLNADICNVENSLLQGYTGIWHATGHNARFLFGDISSAFLSTYILTFGLTFYICGCIFVLFCNTLRAFSLAFGLGYEYFMAFCGVYVGSRAAAKFWYMLMLVIAGPATQCFISCAADFFGMRCSFGNKYGFRFWCWDAPFLPMTAPFLPVIAPPLRGRISIAPFLWTCAWLFCRLGMRPKFWIHEYRDIPSGILAEPF